MPSCRALVVRPDDCPALNTTLVGLPVQVFPFAQCTLAFNACAQLQPDLLFLNVGSVDVADALEFIVKIRTIYQRLPIIMFVSHSSEEHCRSYKELRGPLKIEKFTIDGRSLRFPALDQSRAPASSRCSKKTRPWDMRERGRRGADK